MKSSRQAGLMFLLALGVLGSLSCDRFLAKNAFTALQIVQVQALIAGDCSVSGTPTATTRSQGTLDVALPDGYHAYFLPLVLANNLASVGASKAEELNNITLTNFKVELSGPGITWGDSCPASLSTPLITDLIPPGGTAGQMVMVLSPRQAQCLAPQVQAQPVYVSARITAEGHHGGTTIESAPFDYPIEVCVGCLQTDYKDPTILPFRYPNPIPDCHMLTGNPYPGDSCFPGQDTTILCCGVNPTSFVCPAVPLASTSSTATTTATGP